MSCFFFFFAFSFSALNFNGMAMGGFQVYLIDLMGCWRDMHAYLMYLMN